jgi:hypothetical protein
MQSPFFNLRSGASLLALTAISALGTTVAMKPALAERAIHGIQSIVNCNNPNPCRSFANLGAGDALKGTSTNGNGLSGYSKNNGASGLYGENDNGGYGVAGRTIGQGGFATAGVFGDGGPNTGAAISGYVGTNATGRAVIQALNTVSTLFVLDDSGNVHITGDIFTAGGCNLGCLHTKRVVSYAPREAQPTMEDVGEGRLENGRSVVALEPSFANVIDARTGYFVLLTPEGDSKGLYVTHRSGTGFEVREAMDGHSSISFAYRIVAQPYGHAAARLPVVDAGARAPHALR